MASFQLPSGEQFLKNAAGQGVIWLHVGARITLDLVGPAPRSGADGRDVVSSTPATVAVSDVRKTGGKLTFTLKASSADVVTLTGRDASGANAATLIVAAGDFKNQPGMDIDLLAKICRGSDPAKTLEVQRLLNNFRENIFDQNNEMNIRIFGDNMQCGKVVNRSAKLLFDDISLIDYEHPYHEPLPASAVRARKLTDRYDVRYKAETIDRVRRLTRSLLEKGTPVRVGVQDSVNIKFGADGKLIAYNGGGHTTLIVGCNAGASKFLYIDPWKDGSTMKYEGGIAGAMPSDKCVYLGMFSADYYRTRVAATETNDTGGANLLRQTIETGGTFNFYNNRLLEIISGPPIAKT